MERFRSSSRNRGLSNASSNAPPATNSAPSTPPKILKQLPSKFSWTDSNYDSPRSIAGRMEDFSFASPTPGSSRPGRASPMLHSHSPTPHVHFAPSPQQQELGNHFRNWSFDMERDLPDFPHDAASTSLDSCISPKSKLKTKTPPRTRPHLLRAATVAAAAAGASASPPSAVPAAVPASASPGDDDVLRSEFADSSDEEELAHSGMSSRKPFAIARRFLKTSRGGSTTNMLMREHRSDSTESLHSIPSTAPRMLIFGPPSSSSGPPSLTSASASTSAGSSLTFSPRDNDAPPYLHFDMRAPSPSLMASSVSTAASQSTESLLSSSMSTSSHSFPSLSRWQVSSAIKFPQRKLSGSRSRSNSQNGSIFGWVQDTRSASNDGRPASADPMSSSGGRSRADSGARLVRKPSDAFMDHQTPQAEAARRGQIHRRNNSHTSPSNASNALKRDEPRGRRPSTAAGSAPATSEFPSLKMNLTPQRGDAQRQPRDGSVDAVRSVADMSMDGFYDPQSRDHLTASPAPVRPALRAANSDLPPRAATPAGGRAQACPVALKYDPARRPKLGSQVHSSPVLQTQALVGTSSQSPYGKSVAVPPRPPPPAFPPPPLPGVSDGAPRNGVPAPGASREHLASTSMPQSVSPAQSASRSASQTRPVSSYWEGDESDGQVASKDARQPHATSRSGPQYLAPPSAPSRPAQPANPMIALDPASLRALQRAARAAAARASSTSTLSIVVADDTVRGGRGDRGERTPASNKSSLESSDAHRGANARLPGHAARLRGSEESKSSSGSDSGICRRFSNSNSNENESSDGDHFIKIAKSPVRLGRDGSSSGSGSDERHVFVLSPLPPGEDSDESASEFGHESDAGEDEDEASVYRTSEEHPPPQGNGHGNANSRVRTIPLILPASLCRSPRTATRAFKTEPQTQAHAQQAVPASGRMMMRRSQASAEAGLKAYAAAGREDV